MPRTKTLARPFENTAERCLAHGLRLLKEVGPDRLSLREVARAAELSSAAPYRHFPNKEALLAALAARGFRLFEASLLKGCPNGLHLVTITQFHEMSRHYVRFAMAQPDYYRLMFGNLVRDHRSHPDLWAAAQSSFGVIKTMVEVLQRDGSFRAGSSQTMASHLWSLCHGFVDIHIEGRLRNEHDKKVDVVKLFEPHLQLALEGLKPPASKSL